MEAEGILDPSNATDIFCLHYVFLPRINRTLLQFIAAHNHHPVSTEGNKSPSQLFFLNLNLTALRSGISPEEARNGISVSHFLHNNELPHVQVSDVQNSLDEDAFIELQNTVDPLSDIDGKVLFRQTVQFVGDHIY